jgi:hypothetical protein
VSEAPVLIGRCADVTMTSEDVATQAAGDVRERVLIVMADSSDPARAGLIAGLCRPGATWPG